MRHGFTAGFKPAERDARIALRECGIEGQHGALLQRAYARMGLNTEATP